MKACISDMQHPEQHKKHSNMEGYIIVNKLPQGAAVRAA